MIFPIIGLAPYTSLIAFLIGMPTAVATYYQAFKTRQEARAARDGLLHSRDCLEFVIEDGSCVNLVPLETLHTLPSLGTSYCCRETEAWRAANWFPELTGSSESSISTRLRR